MIRFKTDLGIWVDLTMEQFIKEVDDTIKFAVDVKDYSINEITPDFIAEDITGIIGNHGLTGLQLDIISTRISKLKWS